jgi:ornithine cyclodeaminase/alanine dehydrogenase-like protein (mu-crystallin family)
MLTLTEADIRSAITMAEVIAAVREGFIALSAGRAVVPLRGALPVNDGITLTMPAYVQGDPISVVKVVSVYPTNAALNVPTINGSILALDANTGVPLALLDGASLTAIRTGAASGLATDLLARPQASTLAVIGSGAQARTQIEAIATVRDLQQIRLFSPNNAGILAEEIRSRYPAEIVVTRSVSQALEGVDIIVTATNSRTPVIHSAEVAPGTHINAIGSFKPDVQEIAADIIQRARLVVDHRASAWEEAGDLIIPRDLGLIDEGHVYAEIGEIAAGRLPGRTDPDAVTCFKSVGNAVQDAVVTRLVIEKMHTCYDNTPGAAT